MEFRARVAVQASGLTYRQLDHSLRSGHLRKSRGGGHGSGSPRRFSLLDLLALALLHDALRAGVPMRVVAPALRLVQRGAGLPSVDRLSGTSIWTDGRQAAVVPGPLAGSGHEGVVRYVFDLGVVAERVRSRLAKMTAVRAVGTEAVRGRPAASLSGVTP
jgi:hypothetical protein